jgi:glycosyltransferase involved in cell wall biosynthesis
MRVLMFGWEFPPHISGGLGTASYGMVKGLAFHGLDILFVVPKAYGDEDQTNAKIIGAGDVSVSRKKFTYDDFWKEITYVEVGSILSPYITEETYQTVKSEIEKTTVVTEETELFELTKYQFSGKYGENLLEEVANYSIVAATVATENEFDLIHAHDWLTYPCGIAAKKASGKPLVIHVHATEFDRSGENVNQAVYDIERMGMEAADQIITVSNLTRNIVINKYGINPEKVVTVYNAVEPKIADPLQLPIQKAVDEKIVTFLGRITFQKGPEFFVEAAYKILKKMPNVRFVMAGNGDLLTKMIRRVAYLKMSERFHFTGFLKGAEVDEMFELSDVFVMPSISEPFGIVPLEAMRSNVPVIISRQSGVSEVLKHAVIIDFWDVEAMADSIHSLLKYKGLSKMFKKHGKEEVDNLKWEHAALHIKAVYDAAITSVPAND